MCSVTDVLADSHGRGIVCVCGELDFDFMPLAKECEINSSDNNENNLQRAVKK
jgi:hypothetical protein